jgi:uncharacterized membrane protein YecN with MAPEG domain
MTFPLNITVLYAGLLGLIMLALAINVSRTREATHVSLGDGGNPKMLQAIRMHASFCEYVPLCLILIGLIEMAHGPRWLVHTLGIALVVARLLHAQGIHSAPGRSFGRAAGASLTYLVLAVAACVCTYYGIVWRT